MHRPYLHSTSCPRGAGARPSASRESFPPPSQAGRAAGRAPSRRARPLFARAPAHLTCLLHLVLCVAIVGCATAQRTATAPTVPAAWSLYRSPAGFSLYHPATWQLQEETPRHSLFQLPDRAAFGIGVFEAKCDFRDGCDAFLSCALTLVTHGLEPERQHKVISKGGWGDDGCCGCALESITTGGEREPTYFVQVFIPLAGGRMAVASYYRRGVTEVSQVERQLVDGVVRTLRVASGQQASASEACMEAALA